MTEQTIYFDPDTADFCASEAIFRFKDAGVKTVVLPQHLATLSFLDGAWIIEDFKKHGFEVRLEDSK